MSAGQVSTSRAAQAERTAFVEKAILDAAETVFSRRGLTGTRVREIADAAGVTVGTLYNYYPGKTALYEAVLDRGVRPLVTLMEDFADGPGGLDATQGAVHAVLAHLQEHPAFPRLVYLESIADGEQLPLLAQNWFGPLLRGILAALEREPLPDHLPQELVPAVAALFVHMSFGHFVLSPLLRESLGLDPLSESGIALQADFIELLVRRLFPDVDVGDTAPARTQKANNRGGKRR